MTAWLQHEKNSDRQKKNYIKSRKFTVDLKRVFKLHNIMHRII